MQKVNAQTLALMLIGIGLLLHGVAYMRDVLGDGYRYGVYEGRTTRTNLRTGQIEIAGQPGYWMKF